MKYLLSLSLVSLSNSRAVAATRRTASAKNGKSSEDGALALDLDEAGANGSTRNSSSEPLILNEVVSTQM